MPEIIACVGIPASGKSTFAIRWVLERPGRVRVNRDDIRSSMYGSYWGDNIDERMISAVQDLIIAEALKSGNDVIVDNTNLNVAYLFDLESKARKFKAGFQTMFFDVSLAEALLRNSKRDRRVPNEVIKRMYGRYQALKAEYPTTVVS